MKENSAEKNNLKIETIKTPEGYEVSFCPERGGIITSIKLGGKEILYLDEETLKNKDVNVKGGVPILFPNTGPVDNSKFPGLKQHGFARNSSKWKSEINPRGFKETLLSDQENYESFPYKCQLSVEGKFEENNSFTIIQTTENLEENKEMPLAKGLHPYFGIPKGEKANVKFYCEGKEMLKEQMEVWPNGGTVSIDNPKLKNPEAVLEVLIPGLGILVIDASIEYQKIWIWSLPGKDFVCVEPVMRDAGGLVDDPQMIKPKESYSASVNISLKEIV